MERKQWNPGYTVLFTAHGIVMEKFFLPFSDCITFNFSQEMRNNKKVENAREQFNNIYCAFIAYKCTLHITFLIYY